MGETEGSRTMKRTLVIVAAGIAAAAFAGQSVAASSIGITIRHQKVGCHSWAIGNGPYKATQSLTVKSGTALTFTDNDVMPHQILQVAGPKVAIPGAELAKMGAHTRIVLTKPGTYVFGTKAGEDYTKGIVTVGEDNVLRLIVTVKK
jgi:plastocyanin